LKAFSIGTTFNGIPDSRNPKNTAISAEGRCEDAHKNIVCTYMWLNRCYNNDFNGRLVPVFNGAGNFANSCHGCYVNDLLRAGWLFCNCSMRHDETGAMGTMVQVEANLRKPTTSTCVRVAWIVLLTWFLRGSSLRRRPGLFDLSR
jgi:hypothetical protein